MYQTLSILWQNDILLLRIYNDNVCTVSLNLAALYKIIFINIILKVSVEVNRACTIEEQIDDIFIYFFPSENNYILGP